MILIFSSDWLKRFSPGEKTSMRLEAWWRQGLNSIWWPSQSCLWDTNLVSITRSSWREESQSQRDCTVLQIMNQRAFCPAGALQDTIQTLHKHTTIVLKQMLHHTRTSLYLSYLCEDLYRCIALPSSLFYPSQLCQSWPKPNYKPNLKTIT